MAILLLFMAMGSLFGLIILALFAISTQNAWHRRFALAAVAILVAGLGDSISENIYRLTTGASSYSSKAVYEVPNSPVKIVLERRAIHLFLAEYERTLVLRVGSKELVRAAAAVDTGGYSQMNVYQISPTEFFLSGDLSFDNYFLDISQFAVTQDVVTENISGSKFVGAFDRDEKGWRFIPEYQRPEQKGRF